MHCPSSDSDRPRGPIRGRIALAVLAASAILRPVAAGEIARGEVYSVVELPFRM